MKNQILNTENIEATDFSDETNIISLDFIPTADQSSKLFTDDSIVLEF